MNAQLEGFPPSDFDALEAQAIRHEKEGGLVAVQRALACNGDDLGSKVMHNTFSHLGCQVVQRLEHGCRKASTANTSKFIFSRPRDTSIDSSDAGEGKQARRCRQKKWAGLTPPWALWPTFF